MTTRPSEKQLKQIKTEFDRIHDYKIEPAPIGKLTAKPIGRVSQLLLYVYSVTVIQQSESYTYCKRPNGLKDEIDHTA